MKLKAFLTLALLCTVAQGVWAQWAHVDEETQLNQALLDGQKNIQLDADIPLNKYLNVEGVTATIDLNGHRLYRNLSSSTDGGHIIWIHNNGNLTIMDSSDKHSGTIEGGKATNGGGINVWPGCSLTVNGGIFKNNIASNNGGAIFARNGATISISNASFIGNLAADHGGAVWNNGTFAATNCTFENNSASDVGGIYNSVYTENDITYAGSATLTGCTFKGNVGLMGAGALANAVGATVMTIDGCTIQNNTANSCGAGIWNGGTLNMKGKITVKDNTKVGGMVSNVYLKDGKVITVTGSLAGSHIGIDLESLTGTFTSGYNSYNSGVAPNTLFTVDRSSIVELILSGGEAELVSFNPNPLSYIERSWDATNKKVVNTEMGLTTLIAHDDTPVEGKGQYKEVTNAPAETPDQWFRMGGYCDSVAEYYVVRGEVNRQTIVVQGTNVHLILCNDATLTLTGGLKLEGDNKLFIHCQSYGSDMGRLIVTNSYKNAAGIGSAQDNGAEKTVGELVIHGGYIEATGGDYGAGIGSCARVSGGEGDLCNRVTVYGGYVKATGGDSSAGIGGGSGYMDSGINGGEFILYDGTVIAQGEENASGVGGGGCYYPVITEILVGVGGMGGTVTIYGGSLTANGGNAGAGIGSGKFDSELHTREICGGTFTIFGGTVTATGGDYGAGIGGGHEGGGSIVKIYGGTVTTNGGNAGAGIGGGLHSDCGNVDIYGGRVIANGGRYGAGIGGGGSNDVGGKGGTISITGGTVIAAGGDFGAGIGGGHKGDGGDLTINGGTVTAAGGKEGAGIGGGTRGNGGDLTINGGTVTATGGMNAAGIGGGFRGNGGNVTINGGTVKTQGGEQNKAIGPGNESNDFGTLVIGDSMMVGAGDDGSVESIYDTDERVNACWNHYYAEISPCTHPGATYTIDGNDANGTHTMKCNYCALTFKAEKHNFDETGECTVCHFKLEDIATGIDSMDNGQRTMGHSWYSIDGRKLSSKPTQKGVYVREGKKVVVK